MNDNTPVLTIFMPAYNAEAYLSETIESLLSQSYRSFELIIVDDGSSDGTAAVAQRYADRDPRVRFIRSPHRGEVAARNKALQAANPGTRYLLNHDSDDISLPVKLETLLQYLENHPEVAIVGTLAEYFDDAGADLGNPPLQTSPLDIRNTFQDLNSMINSASMIRREVFETIGGYREDFRSVDDYDFFMRALLSGASLANVPQILHRIRLHPRSVGSTRAALQQQLAQKVRSVYLEHRDLPEPTVLRSPLALSKAYRARPKRGLRILHTVQMYHPHVGGSEEVVKQLSERLVQRGHHVTVATGFHPDRHFSSLNGVEVRQFRVLGSLVRGMQGEVEAFQRFVLDGGFDVVVNYAAQIWSTDLIFPILDRIRGAKVLVPCGYSGLFDPAYREYFRALPAILRKYDRVIHLSENYRDASFSRKHGLSNSMVIGNAASEDEFLSVSESFRERFGIRTPYLAVTVANHYEGKGHNHLLQWFQQLEREDVTLAIIGKKVEGGCWDQCSRAAKSLQNVVLLDNLDRRDVVSALKDADLFWFGSEVECFPLVILEAMAAKTPWLSTDVGNVAELGGGWVAKPEEMVRKANRLLNAEKLRLELGNRGHEQWKARFTWQRIVGEYERLYMSIRPQEKQTLQPVAKPGLVSVVIPCYKQAHYLADAVESVLEQTYTNFEIIIVDDGSPDNTRQVAESLMEQHPNHAIRVISHPNQGLAASRNAAIRAARGEYILPLDSDDKIRPRFLKSCVDILQGDRGIDIVAVDVEEFEDSCRKLSCGNPVLSQVAIENQINYCSLFRRTLWEQVGGYRSNMRWGYEDWDFWISCLERGARVGIVREPLFLYRKRGASMYATALDHDAELRAQIVLNHPGLYDSATERWARALLQLNPPQNLTVEMTAHRVVANYYISRARWNEAMPHLVRLAETGRASGELWFLLGAARLKMKNFASAREALRKCLDELPDHAPAHFLMALSAACLGDDQSAASHAEDALELDLKMGTAYELKFLLCRAQNDPIGADDLLQRSASLKVRMSPWVTSEGTAVPRSAGQWAELLGPNYLAFSPLALLAAKDAGERDRPLPGKPGGSNTPKVSVIVPTCNRPEMLGHALDSVLSQTLQDFEVIVVNDGGMDAEAVVARRNTRGQIKYVRHEKNRGLAAARNTGLRLARGEFIAYLDDDDLFYPDHLQTLVHCLENNDCSVAYTDAYRAHQTQRDGRSVVVHRDIPFSVDFNHDRILVGNFIPVLCVMHRKSCLEETGLFDEALTTHEDWDLWIRLSRKYRFGHIRKATCEFSWRTDGSSMTSSRQRDFVRTAEVIYAKSEDHVRGKSHVVEARGRYLEDKRRSLQMFETVSSGQAV